MFPETLVGFLQFVSLFFGLYYTNSVVGVWFRENLVTCDNFRITVWSFSWAVFIMLRLLA